MRLNEIPTPSYVIDEGKLKKNCELLKSVEDRAGCRILLAQKAFSGFAEYPLIGRYLAGTTASGLYEARLGKEEMGKENHVFCPAYKPEEIREIAEICDHVIFNSFTQLDRFAPIVAELHRKKPQHSSAGRSMGAPTGIGIRLNPECSTQGDHAIYDPCAPGSRMGVTLQNFERGLKEYPEAFKLVDGFHVHTLCEQNVDDLITTMQAVEDKFGKYLRSPRIRWLNLGGGHHITRADYGVEDLIALVQRLRETYDVDIYLEPGEAVALNAGYLVTEVMDIVENGITTLILDASAACHMPDVLEMPYRPPLKDSEEAGVKAFTYRLSSRTCLAGDIIGDYSFDHKIRPGDRLYFEDMAIYSMVKNNTFNGMPLPSIYAMDASGECRLLRKFGYEDFKGRLS
ncbi:carboxynorspermidine decarboxylase [Oribacterium sp. HCP28S3_H8]|uniref:carboxynorspermidine decarboxylase n=1 Tax=Oribacterium sp. HCP28S3_H8 TaxID=3438945 RepID=UPI003F8886E2